MKHISLSLSTILFASAFQISAQQYSTHTYHTYPFPSWTGCQVNSNEYILAGGSNDSAFANWNHSFIRIDGSGNIINAFAYDRPDHYDECQAVISTSDNGLLMVGYADTIGGFNPVNRFPQAIKINQNNQVQWARLFQTNQNAYFTSVIETTNGDFVFVGEHSDPIGSDAYILKTNMNGDTLWEKSIGKQLTNGVESFRKIILTNNNNYLVVGQTSLGAGSGDLLVVRLNSNGDTLWTRVIGMANRTEIAFDVFETNGGNFFVGGLQQDHTGGTGANILLLKINSSGNILWAKNYGSIDDESAATLAWNNNLILIGGTSEGGTNDPYSDALIMAVDTSGNFQWAHSQTDYGNEQYNKVYITSPYAFIGTGYDADNVTGSDVRSTFIKRSYSEMPCKDSSLNFTTGNLTMVQSYCPFVSHRSCNSRLVTATVVSISIVDSMHCEYTSVPEENHAESNFLLYPNPNNGTFSISANHMAGSRFTYEIFSLSGALLMSGTLYPNTFFNTDLPNGVFNLRIFNESYFSENRFVVVRD